MMQMTSDSMNLSPKCSGDPESQRQFGRVNCEAVNSNIGPVVDASAGGMRILFMGRNRIKVGMELDLSIAAFGEPFTVPVKIVWIKKRSLFKREIGVQFVEVTPELKRALNAMARSTASNLSYMGKGTFRHAS